MRSGACTCDASRPRPCASGASLTLDLGEPLPPYLGPHLTRIPLITVPLPAPIPFAPMTMQIAIVDPVIAGRQEARIFRWELRRHQAVQQIEEAEARRY
jgi:hypothetical protein